MIGRLKKLLSVAVLFLLLGCSEQYRKHGYIPSEEELSSVSISQDDKSTVIKKLGTPSIGGVLNDGNIYFVQSKVLKNSIRASKPVDRQVLVLSFDDKGKLDNIQKFGIEKGKVVILDYRTTPSGLKNMSFLFRLFQNVGGPSAETLLQ
tara:strand:- start:192 stop:638 length:447 start_codon:yes stop_codon:yes gene_type:complete